jgi:molybdopterin adenylyltransferase
MPPVRLGILTVSDGVSRGQRQDASGDAIAAWAGRHGWTVVARDAVPDQEDRIRDRLLALTDSGEVDLVLTTGGTGFTDRDVTPEATRAVIGKEAPGLAEALRHAGSAATPYAWLSRGVAGIRGATLIVNLPGSTGGVRDGLALLERLAPHAVQLLRGTDTHLHPGHG